MARPATDGMTIDELARETGVTSRNIRAYQTRGLLPPPQVRGRTGYYGPDHVARLRLIQDLQDTGFTLRSIKHLLDTVPPGADQELLRLERTLLAPWETEETEEISAADLFRRFPGAGPAALREAERLGILTALPGDRYRVESPSVLRAGEELTALGVPLQEALQTLRKIGTESERIAAAFVDLFMRNVWEPFVASGSPPAELRRVREALERLRPLSSSVVTSVFRRAMTREVESAVGEELGRGAEAAESAS